MDRSINNLNTLIDEIKKLTRTDKKTLSQKIVKLFEETGELAKVALPFDNAAGTLHKFTDAQNLLEEVSDSIIVLLSIAYELNFSTSQILDMVNKKIKYWNVIQNNENEDTFPFELHLTIKKIDNLYQFKNICANLGLKPIVLDLHTKNDCKIEDIMTSSKYKCTNREIVEKMNFLTETLTVCGFEVIRKKIETVPWHPNVKLGKNNDKKYFESHIAIKCDEDVEDVLKYNFSNAHFSKNKMKKCGNDVLMVTLREYHNDFKLFKENLDDFIYKLKMYNTVEIVEKDIIEWAIYDSNIDHDNEWVNK